MKACELKRKTLAIMNGDCHVDINEKSGKARLDIYHSEDNYDLIEYKKSILENINGVSVSIKEKVDSRKLKSGMTRKGYRLQTNFSRYFYKLKTMPFKAVCKQMVVPDALAVLWQDDGTVCWDRQGYFSTATLAVDDWDLWKVEELRKSWNNQYGWCPKIMDYKCRGSHYYRLRLVKKEFEKLCESTFGYTCESMKYKVTYKTTKS